MEDANNSEATPDRCSNDNQNASNEDEKLSKDETNIEKVLASYLTSRSLALVIIVDEVGASDVALSKIELRKLTSPMVRLNYTRRMILKRQIQKSKFNIKSIKLSHIKKHNLHIYL